AKAAREAHQAVQGEKREHEREIRTQEELAGFELGPGDAMAILYEQCIEFDSPEYVYELCFFKDANQRAKNGGSVYLGKWEGFTGQDQTQFSGKDRRHLEGQFAHGTGCWNGPARSVAVEFECGPENAVVGLSEPSKCEYRAKVLTPGACDDDGGDGNDEGDGDAWSEEEDGRPKRISCDKSGAQSNGDMASNDDDTSSVGAGGGGEPLLKSAALPSAEAKAAASAAAGAAAAGGPKHEPAVILCIGMAGSGKTTFMQRLAASISSAKRRGYVVNLDPAVGQLPFGANIDIRDTV
ncbi:hypothetical protein HK405_015846, partial [Cladochytrium tenue]